MTRCASRSTNLRHPSNRGALTREAATLLPEQGNSTRGGKYVHIETEATGICWPLWAGPRRTLSTSSLRVHACSYWGRVSLASLYELAGGLASGPYTRFSTPVRNVFAVMSLR